MTFRIVGSDDDKKKTTMERFRSGKGIIRSDS